MSHRLTPEERRRFLEHLGWYRLVGLPRERWAAPWGAGSVTLHTAWQRSHHLLTTESFDLQRVERLWPSNRSATQHVFVRGAASGDASICGRARYEYGPDAFANDPRCSFCEARVTPPFLTES